MAEVDNTSSMTSVTEEEESSIDCESDTTESSCSNITSSFLSSTGYNTDDKLTPSLLSISISSGNDKKGRSASRKLFSEEHMNRCETEKMQNKQEGIPYINSTNFRSKTSESDTNPEINNLPEVDSNSNQMHKQSKVVHSYGSNPLPLEFADREKIKFRKPAKNNLCDRNENKNLSSSDVSSQYLSDSLRQDNRSYLPDMFSSTWFQAGCFDNYWRHYNFVMDWYQKHLEVVKMLQSESHYLFQRNFQVPKRLHQTPRQPGSHKSRKSRRTKRARNRRMAKARQRERAKEVEATNNSKEDNSEEELEMEITDDMMAFFTTSMKHRLERDGDKKQENGKEEDVRINIEEAVLGQHARSSCAPVERPGVKRAAEMQLLYGDGAAMVHGMETALQMNFDRVSDKFQPKPWPNMPLKIVFG